MTSAEMPTTQDTAIVNALGRPLDVLYARAAAGTADLVVQRVLELRSFLAVIEDQAGKARDRIHRATGPLNDLYGLSAENLQFQTALLEAAQAAGRRYEQMLRELLPAMSAPAPSQRRPVRFTQSKIAAISPLDGGLTARPGRAGEPAAGVSAARHRR
jgi:hypothetical protein